MDAEWLTYRVRSVLDRWFPLVVVVLVALALAGGWYGVSTLTGPETTTEERSIEVWSTTSGFDHEATVLVENQVFEVGDTLLNRGTYFTRVTPELEVEFTHEFEAGSQYPAASNASGAEANGPEVNDTDVNGTALPLGGNESAAGTPTDRSTVDDVPTDVQTTITVEQVIRAVGDEDEVYWQVSEPVNETSVDDLASGETVAVPVTLDVPTFANRSELMADSLGGTPGDVETILVAEVRTTGTVDGESVRYRETHELHIDADDAAYHVDGPGSERHVAERTVTHEVEAPQELGSLAPSLLVALLASGTLGALAIVRRRDDLAPDAATTDRVRRRRERERFDEWISVGRVPDSESTTAAIEVETLADLVDVAIDTDSRVIEDRAGDRVTYHVLDGTRQFRYVPGVEGSDPLDADLD